MLISFDTEQNTQPSEYILDITALGLAGVGYWQTNARKAFRCLQQVLKGML